MFKSLYSVNHPYIGLFYLHTNFYITLPSPTIAGWRSGKISVAVTYPKFSSSNPSEGNFFLLSY